MLPVYINIMGRIREANRSPSINYSKFYFRNEFLAHENIRDGKYKFYASLTDRKYL